MYTMYCGLPIYSYFDFLAYKGAILNEEPSIEENLIPTEDMRTFRSYFAPSYTQSPSYQSIDASGQRQSWNHFKNSILADCDIYKHLKGYVYYGTPLPKHVTYTAVIAIDIDVNTAASIRKRYDGVVRAMAPATPIPFRSPGGGLHVYFILEKTSYRTWAIAEAEKRLNEEGLIVQGGFIEIMEKNSNRRIPLGPGCPLLNSQTLEPFSLDRIECFYTLVDALRGDRIERLPIPRLLREEDPHFAQHYRTVSRPKTFKNKDKGEWETPTVIKAKYWLSSGLTDRGQRREAQLDLVRYYRGSLRKNADEAHQIICQWLDENNNDQSLSYKTSPKTCYNDIRHLCDHWDDGIWRFNQTSRNDVDSDFNRKTMQLNNKWIDQITEGKKGPRKILELFARMGFAYGTREADGGYSIEMSSRFLKRNNSHYNVPLKKLMDKGCIQLVRNHFNPPVNTMRGRAKTYKISPDAFI